MTPALHSSGCGWVAALTAALVVGAGTAAAEPKLSDALRGEAFEAAQWATVSETAEAMAKVAARFARGDGPLAKAAEERERLAMERERLARRLEGLYLATGEDGEEQRRQLRAEYGAMTARLGAADQKIAADFPEYAALTRAQPLDEAATRALLASDEALVLILTNDDAAYVWALTREGATWARAPTMPAARVTELVGLLREYLASGGRSGTFDRDAAYELYAGLLQPIEAILAGKGTLITVTGGALASLPMSVLMTLPPGPETAVLQTAPWLAEKYALASLPAVSSLRVLRCLTVSEIRAAGCEPLSNHTLVPRAAPRSILTAFGAPAGLRPSGRGVRGAPRTESVFRGPLADSRKLRELRALPGAERELAALKVMYPGALVRTGPSATEPTVKVIDAAALADSRFVVFSTHGLLAGQAGASEPGLVLTPPKAATSDDDGYLSASEAAQLRLNADFVVLSACNTAAADGSPGGEGLSGLARSFFYAGARSLLVSHWEISDEASVDLIAGTFDALKYGSRAKALQLAQRRLRGNPKWSDPSYWAAFTLVGAP